VYVITVLVIDPHNIFGVTLLFDTKVKKQIMQRSNNTCVYDNAIFSFAKFTKSPSPNIILGDSRPFLFDMNYINHGSNDTYSNLSIPGGDLKSICDSLEFAQKSIKLRKVLIGISFHKSNASIRSDIVPEIEKILSNKIKYFVNSRVISACTALIISRINLNGSKGKSIKNPRTKEVKWNEIIKGLEFNAYKYPTEELNRLNTLVKALEQNGAEIIFIMFPGHIDISSEIDSHSLNNYRDKFVMDIANIGKLYNFDFTNEFTSDYDNYNDPLHTKKWVYNSIAEEVIGFQKKNDLNEPLNPDVPYMLHKNGAIWVEHK